MADRQPKTRLGLSDAERQLLVDEVLWYADHDGSLARVLRKPGPATLELTLEDWDDLAGYVAASANHADTPRVARALRALYDRIDAILYPDEPESGDGGAVILQLPLPPYANGRGANGRHSPAPPSQEPPDFDARHALSDWIADLLEAEWGDDEGPVSLNADLPLEALSGARFFANCRLMLQMIEEAGGAKTTDAGNLTRKFVAEMLERGQWDSVELATMHRVSKVINEHDVTEIHAIRILLQEARLIRKCRMRFLLTRQARELIADHLAGPLFRMLFVSLFRRINLAYLDGAPELPLVQDGAAVSLYAMAMTGHAWQSIDELADLLLAQPVLRSLEGTGFPGEAGRVVRLRLLRYWHWFGLIEERKVAGKGLYGEAREYRKTPLFDQFIRFNAPEWIRTPVDDAP